MFASRSSSRPTTNMILVLALLNLVHVTHAIALDVQSRDSICAASALAVDGLMDYRDFSKGIGLLSDPYYWWHAGSAYGGVLEYGFVCQNDTWDQVIHDSLMAQTGENYDYIPANQSMTEGNDDQGFWGILVMHAAERNFTAPTGDVPDWLALSQAVYNTMWARWDYNYCGGGLRWQIFTWNSGYHYKNTISTGCLFNMAARLARFTQNDTYADTAEYVYDWLLNVHFLEEIDDSIRVYDGASINENCSDVVHLEWSYNFALLLGGAAYMYNYTESPLWLERTTRLWTGSKVFFEDGIMFERACQGGNNCNNDQRSFRSVLARFMGLTGNLVPSLAPDIVSYLQSSSEAAARSCTGGTDGHTCGQNWFIGEWDGKWGLGEQMAALEHFNALLVIDGESPITQEAEGAPQGNVAAGLGKVWSLDHDPLTITAGDTAGASILTAVVLIILTGGGVWMVM